jgi:hypothetical protein
MAPQRHTRTFSSNCDSRTFLILTPCHDRGSELPTSLLLAALHRGTSLLFLVHPGDSTVSGLIAKSNPTRHPTELLCYRSLLRPSELSGLGLRGRVWGCGPKYTAAIIAADRAHTTRELLLHYYYYSIPSHHGGEQFSPPSLLFSLCYFLFQPSPAVACIPASCLRTRSFFLSSALHYSPHGVRPHIHHGLTFTRAKPLGREVGPTSNACRTSKVAVIPLFTRQPCLLVSQSNFLLLPVCSHC